MASYASFLACALWRSFSGPKPDVVVTLTTPPLTSVLGTLLKFWRGSRHFIWEMDVYPDIALDLHMLRARSPVAKLIGFLSDRSRRHAEGIIVLGEDMKIRLTARGIPEHKITVGENWADGTEITRAPFPRGPLVVHYSGNLGLAHDTETISSAMYWLRNNPRLRFIFAGGGPRRSALEGFCIQGGISNVTFAGYSSSAAFSQSLAEGHIGLVTQKPETLGSIVPSKSYGIMAAGRPILYIGPRAATPARIIERFNCGWQIDPGNVDGLVSLLEELAEDRNSIYAPGLRARKAFEEHYDRPVGVARIAAILGIQTSIPASAVHEKDRQDECTPSYS